MKMPVSYEQTINCLILGDQYVGKTNFLIRFIKDDFSNNYISTIGIDYRTKEIKLEDDRIVKLNLWDTAGQERFFSITKGLLLRV
jgi:Ras-related protein Rab-1A